MKSILNLYAGLGGNRALWPSNWQVTAVEYDARIAKLYQKQFSKDKVLVEDAHAYLEKNYREYDAIWSSPPCPTHSQLMYIQKIKRFPSMILYEEIIFLEKLIKTVPYIIENVKPYYEPLIWPTMRASKHYFWSSCKQLQCQPLKGFPGLGNNHNTNERLKHQLKWLGLKLELKDFNGLGLRVRQVVDNCVHPVIGLHLMKQLLNK